MNVRFRDKWVAKSSFGWQSTGGASVEQATPHGRHNNDPENNTLQIHFFNLVISVATGGRVTSKLYVHASTHNTWFYKLCEHGTHDTHNAVYRLQHALLQLYSDMQGAKNSWLLYLEPCVTQFELTRRLHRNIYLNLKFVTEESIVI